jgi:CHAT domain-containing protein
MSTEEEIERQALFAELARLPRDVAAMPRRIELCRQALNLVQRERSPKLWASLQYELGMSYARTAEGDRADNLEQAIKHYWAALEVYTRQAFPEEWAETQHNLGNVYFRRIKGPREANLKQAITLYQETTEIWTREKYPVEGAQVQENLGTAWKSRSSDDLGNNLEKAKEYYEAALEVLTEDRHPWIWARVQYSLGIVLLSHIHGKRVENLEQAIGHFQKALKIRTRDIYPREWSETQHNLAIAYMERQTDDRAENIELAIKLCEEVLEVRKPETFLVERAMTLNALANAYNRRIRGDRAENLELAIRYYREAIELQTRVGPPEERATTQHNMGVAFSQRLREDRVKNLKRAIEEYYNEALHELTQETFPIQWATVQTDLADAFWNLGNQEKGQEVNKAAIDFELAISHCENALKVYERQNFPAKWALAQYNLGNAYSDRLLGRRGENLELAIKRYKASLEVYSKDAYPFEYARTLNSLAVTYLERDYGARKDNLDKAVELFNEAIQVYRELGVRTEERRSAANLAFLYYGEQRWPEAHDALRDVLKVIEAMRSDALGDMGQVDIAKENTRLYELMIDTCLRLGPCHYTEALIAAEANKARAFLAQMGYEEIPLPHLKSEFQHLVQPERKLIQELRGYEDRIHYVTSADKRLDLVQQQDKARTKLNDIWRQLELHAPEYVALRRGDQVKYNQLQCMVDGFGTAALVEFYTLPDRIIAFVLRSGKKKPVVAQVLITQDKLQSHVDDYRREVTEYRQRGDIGQRWQELAGPLLEKVLPHLQDAGFVYLVPHGPLHYLPLHALQVDGGYLIDRCPIIYAPSAAVLGRVVERTRGVERMRKLKALVAGNPTMDLVYAEVEAQQVAELFHVPPYLGRDAIKATIQDELKDKDVVHLACHGDFHPTQPLQSGVVFAGKEMLTAQEIMGLSLQANLVTLSACRTGRSEIYSGDELVGFTRALLYAGASSVVVSLWAVDDVSTAILMEQFYSALQQGQSKAQALKSAALCVRDMTTDKAITYVEKIRASLAQGRETDEQIRIDLDKLLDVLYTQDWLAQEEQTPIYPFRHPFYWAPFVLVGGWQ